MCGIVGQFNYANDAPVDELTLRRMAHSISHRGPDDEGFFFDRNIGLGFRRLSIIDFSGGHQPMSDFDQSVWVVFNGEIYNYVELRAELESKGHQFQTRSDTEVIVHGYKEWGVNVLKHFNGMFGLAIWDVQKRRLVAARDAMGIKLVYYRVTNAQLTFGSEIRAVMAANNLSSNVDPIALNRYLRFRYVPSPLTMFSDICKLAPGEMLKVENGQFKVERWYDYMPTPFDHPKEDEEAADELMNLYRAAVKRHLLSDVPVGILLSGGLDSGLLLALMNEQGKAWPAFTVGYGESFEDDELADAAETARQFQANFIPVKIDRTEYEHSFAKIVNALEEPVASSSIVPMYFVCQRAKKEVKVVLIGQGPDELFAGYKRHIGVHYGNFWRRLPSPLRWLMGTAVNALPRNETLKRGIQSLGIDDRLLRYHNIFSLAPSSTIDGLFQDGVLPKNQDHRSVSHWQELLPQMKYLDELGAFQLIELRSSLPDELLMFADKLSMTHSLEVRVPYLDRTVVEFAQRLGSGFFIRNRQQKWIHRQVCRDYLPTQTLKRKKRGFAVNVVDDWFRTSVQGPFTETLLNEKSLMFNLLKRDPVQKLLKDHRSGRHDNHKLLFSLVMFEQWLRTVQNTTDLSSI